MHQLASACTKIRAEHQHKQHTNDNLAVICPKSFSCHAVTTPTLSLDYDLYVCNSQMGTTKKVPKHQVLKIKSEN